MFWLYHNGGWVVQWRNTNAYSYSVTHRYAKGNSEAAANAASAPNALRMKGPDSRVIGDQ